MTQTTLLQKQYFWHSLSNISFINN